MASDYGSCIVLKLTQIEIWRIEFLERCLKGFLNISVIRVCKLGCKEYFFSGNARRSDSLSDLSLIIIARGGTVREGSDAST